MQEQGHKGNPEHEENGDDAALDPLEDGDQVVASRLSRENVLSGRVLADEQLLVQSTEVHQREHEDLNGHHNELSSQ